METALIAKLFTAPQEAILKLLIEKGVFTEEEYHTKRRELIGRTDEEIEFAINEFFDLPESLKE